MLNTAEKDYLIAANDQLAPLDRMDLMEVVATVDQIPALTRHGEVVYQQAISDLEVYMLVAAEPLSRPARHLIQSVRRGG